MKQYIIKIFSPPTRLRAVFSAALAAVVVLGASGIRAEANPDIAPVAGTAVAQVTPTPMVVQINSPTPLPLVAATITPTFTPGADEQLLQTSALLEALVSAGSVNVRFEANIDSNLVGTIEAGDQYVVTGKFGLWYRISFEESPDGTGWVFEELVEIIGDASTIPDLSLTPLPTSNPTLVVATQTAAVLLLTPGAVLSATANTREITGPVAAINSEGTTVVDPQGTGLPQNTPLPTFTYPPEIDIAAQSTAETGDTSAPEIEPTVEPSLTFIPDTVPPLVPIAVLGGFGLLGLAVASLRR